VHRYRSPQLILKRVIQESRNVIRVRLTGPRASETASIRYFYGPTGMLAEPQKGRRITKGTALVDRTQAIAIIDQIPYDAVDLVLLASGAMPEQITDVRVAGSSPARPTEVRFPIDLGGRSSAKLNWREPEIRLRNCVSAHGQLDWSAFSLIWTPTLKISRPLLEPRHWPKTR
jgi:hypothetical protein